MTAIELRLRDEIGRIEDALEFRHLTDRGAIMRERLRRGGASS